MLRNGPNRRNAYTNSTRKVLFSCLGGTMSNSVFRYYGDESKQFSFCRIPIGLLPMTALSSCLL